MRKAQHAYLLGLRRQSIPKENNPMHVQELLAQARDLMTVKRVFGDPNAATTCSSRPRCVVPGIRWRVKRS